MKTDKQLRSDVQDELEWEPSVDAGTVGVSVEHGVVTLSGTVRSYFEKWAAEDATERVAGVKAVANELEVKLPGEYARSDQDIARAAVNALAWTSNVPPDKVKVEVDHGFITLEGEVNLQFQRDAAEDAVRNLVGVTGVANEVTLKPTATVGAIKQEIEKAFNRSAQIDASQISVGVFGSKVILSGQVRTWTERDNAEDAAWRAPGVMNVENDLQVTS